MEKDTPLCKAVHSFSLALSDIHKRLIVLEDCIFSEDRGTRLHLQELDYILQSVVALSEFSKSLAAEIPDEFRVSLGGALQEVPIEAISSLLSGAHHGKIDEPLQGSRNSPNEVDFF